MTNSNTALKKAQAAYGAAQAKGDKAGMAAAAAAGQAARATGATSAGAQAVWKAPAAKAPVVPTGGGGSSGGGSAPNYAQSGYAMPSGGTAMVTDSMKQQMIANAAKQGKDVSGNFYGIDVPAWQTAINLGADHSIANRVARGEIGLSDLPSLMTSPRPVALGGYLADGSPFQSDQAFWNSFDTGIQKAGYSPDYSRLAREAVFDQLDAGTYGQPINLSALVPQSGQANAGLVPTAQQGINWNTYLGDLARRYSDPGYDAGRATPDRILTEMQRVSQAQGIPMPSMGAPLIPTAQIPLPQYQPYEPKPFVPQAPPFQITAGGDETWTPTGAAIDAWHQQEADKAAQYDKQFGIQYGIQQDAQERQRLAEQEAGNRRAAEQEIQMQAQEAAYKQAYDRWNAAGVVVSDADAQILGVPKGTKTSDHSYRLASTAISQMKAAATGAPKASTPKSTQTERDRAALADAYGAIHAAFAQGLTADQIEQNIRSQQAELTRRGIDPKILVQYAYDNDPNTPATNKKPGLWSQIDQRLGGWLPLGTPRK